MESLQSMERISIFFFPHKFRYAGFVFIFLGIVAGYLYYFGGKPDFFVSPVFAMVTSYLETRFFVMAQTNLLDEIAAVFTICGFALLGFSKEKSENGGLNSLRLKAFVYATYFSILVWIILILVIYGWPVFIFSSFIFLVFIITYLVLIRFLIFRKTRLTDKISKN